MLALFLHLLWPSLWAAVCSLLFTFLQPFFLPFRHFLFLAATTSVWSEAYHGMPEHHFFYQNVRPSRHIQFHSCLFTNFSETLIWIFDRELSFHGPRAMHKNLQHLICHFFWITFHKVFIGMLSMFCVNEYLFIYFYSLARLQNPTDNARKCITTSARRT